MPASYPGGIKSFTTVNNGDTSDSSQVDSIYDEVTAIETALINGFQHNVSPLNDNSKDLGDATHAWKNLWTKGTTQFNGIAYTWPAADGAANQVLQTNGSKTFAWASIFSVATTTSTGAQNDFAPGLVGNTILRCNNATLLTINGFAGGYDGQRLTIVSIGAGQVDLAHQNTGSIAANRLINFATSGSTSLAAGSGFAEYEYDATTLRWRLIACEQGAWIAGGTPTLAGSGSMTVTSPVLTAFRYRLSGRTLTVHLTTTFTIGGTPSNTVLWTLPGGFTVAGVTDQRGLCLVFNNNAHVAGAYRAGVTTTAQVNVFANTDISGGTNWTAGANEGIEQVFMFEVS